MRHSEIQRVGTAYLVRNTAVDVELPDWLFDPASLAERGLVRATSEGRRRTWFLEYAGLDLVLRHYWRGGMVARVSPDVYVWTGWPRTRPVAEYRLMAALRELGLPVPQPIAARVQRERGPTYRGDLLTRTVPDARSFAERIEAGDDDAALWAEVGETVARFHRQGAAHADLNARNILVGERGDVWLIDWDRGRLGRPQAAAGERNIARLRRSLAREPGLEASARVRWDALLQAYRAAVAKA